MGIWTGKKRNNGERKVISDNEVIVNDFMLRAPYSDYRAVSYEILPAFSMYQNEIDKYLEEFFKGEVDDGNGDMLDSLIDDMTRIALYDLAKQKTVHDDLNRSLTDIRMVSDKKQYSDEKTRIKDALEEVDKQLKDIRSRCMNSIFCDSAANTEEPKDGGYSSVKGDEKGGDQG